MDYKIIGHDHRVAAVDMIQVFFPGEKYKALEEGEYSSRFIESRFESGLINARFFVDSLLVAEARLQCVCIDIGLGVKESIYELFKGKYHPPWGLLTGIRPAKIVSKMIDSGLSETDIIRSMQEKYLASPAKAALCLEVAKAERDILEATNTKSYALYIGVPFCPSRCLYCSFTAYPVAKYTHLTKQYIAAVKKELDYAARLYKEKELESVYVGGGTPTSLDDESFSQLLEYTAKTFDMANLKEYTIEAGRADTISESKLDIMRHFGVSRISINPQSMKDETLVKIGRKHSAAEFVKAYNLARKKGFSHINVDIILGLPDENEADVSNTLKEITALLPEEITVHTLALKRASKLKEEISSATIAEAAQMEKFLGLSKYYMDNFSYKPYYMYRQKNSPGNFENAGYRKDGYGCLYNVQIMHERQSIIAAGAGAVSKFVNADHDRIERAFNVKNVDEYIERTAEMIRRKTAAYNKAAKGVLNNADH